MALFFHHSPPARSILIPIDRFSTLPVEIKLNILEHISFEEAARASISRTINWSEHPQVILDKPLFDEWGRWIRLDPGGACRLHRQAPGLQNFVVASSGGINVDDVNQVRLKLAHFWSGCCFGVLGGF
ncbi:uncharacterized protein LOC114268195 isoform X2 [Camellia sinensis]|uniref:uncharacterized protein LOC114268195 isoform X2 n=1 Tax=Camellia sinensis TaxID=4442 RepID=UPI001036BFD3|nr:uncharacterized protein LOC114268195 isoform X2 [Camellia sinensis]